MIDTKPHDVTKEEVEHVLETCSHIRICEDHQKLSEELGILTWLQQLAEEASELAQATTKMMRSLGTGLHTPVKPNEAFDNIIEEYQDASRCVETVIHLMRKDGVQLHVDEVDRDVMYKKAKMLLRYGWTPENGFPKDT